MAKYRILEDQVFSDNKHYIYAAGTSNDDKPEGEFVNGSLALEVDTRKVYLWNEDINDWDDGEGGGN
ncbi:MAG: hypothetical protein K5663_11350 [Clostridiales bacterium]|nr:hypothetical protein [Clostridiales bacterium]